jgi:pimeloyl-ACP methyl ester carboxylesterase
MLAGAGINYAVINCERPFAAPHDIVLIHGLATNISFWYFGIAKALAHLGRVIVFDLRGHGMSTMPVMGYTADEMVDDLKGVLAETGVERAHVIGHSYGGLVAAAFAAAHPQTIRSLVLADVRLPSVQPKLQLGKWALARGFAEKVAQAGIEIHADDPDFGLELLTQLAKLRVAGRLDGDAVEHVFGGARRIMGARAASKWLRLLETTTAKRDFAAGSKIKPSDLGAVTAPIFGVYGQNSMTLESGQALSDALPNFRFKTLAGAGHFFPAARPRQFAMLAGAFLAEKSGAPRFGPRAFDGAGDEHGRLLQ